MCSRFYTLVVEATCAATVATCSPAAAVMKGLVCSSGMGGETMNKKDFNY